MLHSIGTRASNQPSYGIAALAGFIFAFVVFAISFNYPNPGLLSAIRILYVLLPAINLGCCLLRGVDPIVVAALINGPPLLVWYAIVPDDLQFYVPLFIIVGLSGLAVLVAWGLGRYFGARER